MQGMRPLQCKGEEMQVEGMQVSGAEMKRHYDSARHRAWAEKVLRKDKYLCQRCLRYGKKVPANVAHHIKPIEFYPELALDVSNGEALCAACHNAEHPEKGGARWNPPRY